MPGIFQLLPCATVTVISFLRPTGEENEIFNFEQNLLPKHTALFEVFTCNILSLTGSNLTHMRFENQLYSLEMFTIIKSSFSYRRRQLCRQEQSRAWKKEEVLNGKEVGCGLNFFPRASFEKLDLKMSETH